MHCSHVRCATSVYYCVSIDCESKKNSQFTFNRYSQLKPVPWYCVFVTLCLDCVVHLHIYTINVLEVGLFSSASELKSPMWVYKPQCSRFESFPGSTHVFFFFFKFELVPFSTESFIYTSAGTNYPLINGYWQYFR